MDRIWRSKLQLATDKFDGIKAPAAALAARAEGLGEAGAGMAKAARTVGNAPDLKAARDAFGGLSDAVIAAAKAEGWKDLSDVKLAYCPMVQRSWLQKDEKISNPYYGSAMLDVRRVQEALIATGASPLPRRWGQARATP